MNLNVLEEKWTVSKPDFIEKEKQLKTPAIFKFFASVRLAIPLLLLLMGALAAGTFLESAISAETAKILVYESPWFSLLLFFIGVNVLFAALDRWPWKRRHVGFVITHAGILLVLLGSFLTQRLMVDAQMAISEGDTERFISLQDPVLFLTPHAVRKEWQIPIKKHAFAWQGMEKLKMPKGQNIPFAISTKTFYPKSEMKESVEEAATGPCAFQVTLYNSFVRQTHWLVQDHPSFEEVALGPANIRFENEISEPEEWLAAPESPYLEFQFKHKNVFIPVTSSAKLTSPIRLKGTPYQIEILKVFENAAVIGTELVENKDGDRGPSQPLNPNPAIQLVLRGKDLEERHTIFSNFPEFPTVHGMKPSASGVRIFYRLPQAGSRGESHELIFALKSGELYYQLREGPKSRSQKVKIGEETATGWMDLKFKVEKFYPHAAVQQRFTAVSPASKNEAHRSAALVEIQDLKDPSKQKPLWLRQDITETVEWDKESYHLILTQRRMPLGFRVKLTDFKIEHYPGTDNPASFESDVVLKDDGRAFQKEATLSMNHPLIYRGWRIYQSGYSLPEGSPEISVFSVARDPGIPVKYAGALIMVAGVLLMFYTRKFSTSAGRIG